MSILALVLAGGRGSRLDILSADRAKPGVPFAGKYRIIDFTLSNCVNSGIYDVGILTQYLPRSLHRHIGIGKPWDLDRQFGGVTLLHPYIGKEGGWYQGTAHAVYQNLLYIKNKKPDYVVILSGDHIYKMDYSKMVDYHKSKNADLTIAAKPVPIEEAHQFGILNTNEDMRIVDFKEKPENPPSNLASMGIYVFSTDVLINKLEEFCSQKNSDFGHHIIPQMIRKTRVFAYKYKGYWKDVGTIKSFWEANLSLINPLPEMDLYDDNWKWHTRSESKPPAKFGREGEVNQSLISNGAIINGKIKNSVVFPGVFIEEGVEVKDSIIFNNTIIKQGAKICKSIIDKNVVIGNNTQIGFYKNTTANFERPKILNSGLNVIGKGVRIPENIEIGQNCRVLPRVKEDDFNKRKITSGSTIRPRN
ncbi:glucose-1-phosphate adenylyltransferase [Selenihalanaerobacter shriftii]|uniref:Glucose-1-phosphate adenylyltransferase n=1 Tax=Selenihalanaerobacter shriftii TaxID=142842 RepID=A0A1T4LBK3_9FIRM|nr:glucose-1-phosphate adenylyltransferase [Selenihalanaerobacter shriftii]SJZ51887.1 glucose-1-phosphate adenylyltransferase [Selenihalanaerobacter shriftii]